MQGLQVQLRSASPIRLEAEFDCGAGELVALVGPSGSGKTSMLRAIAGLWTPADVQGHIRVAGQAWLDTAAGVQLSPQQRRAGLVFQHYALFPHMTAQANVALAAGPGWSSADVQTLLARLGLATLSQRRPSQLSGGQQQRVALARALVRVMPRPTADATPTPQALPGVLLLDEPFSAVDAPTRQTLYRELAALRQKVSVPMVLVTHDLAEARRLADRVVIVDAGQTLQTGEPARVFASPLLQGPRRLGPLALDRCGSIRHRSGLGGVRQKQDRRWNPCDLGAERGTGGRDGRWRGVRRCVAWPHPLALPVAGGLVAG
jgi:molybdate transport system ATP-binding protein